MTSGKDKRNRKIKTKKQKQNGPSLNCELSGLLWDGMAHDWQSMREENDREFPNPRTENYTNYTLWLAKSKASANWRRQPPEVESRDPAKQDDPKIDTPQEGDGTEKHCLVSNTTEEGRRQSSGGPSRVLRTFPGGLKDTEIIPSARTVTIGPSGRGLKDQVAPGGKLLSGSVLDIWLQDVLELQGCGCNLGDLLSHDL